MAPWPVFVVAGAVIGLLIGLFGVGGSSIATPLLAVLGLPGLLAVATPLPATIPSALVAAISYLRNGEARPRAAGWTMLGATPAAIAGALLSPMVGASKLLIASGFVLIIVGGRRSDGSSWDPGWPSSSTASSGRRAATAKGLSLHH